MTMVEWFVEADFHHSKNGPQKPVKGRLSDAEIDRLKKLVED